jgi:hypothetical protein
MKATRFVWKGALALFLVVLACSNLPAETQYLPAKLAHPLEAKMPQDLKHLFMDNPRVTFHVKVAPDGQMLDAMAVEATHFGLLKKAEEKILEAKFEPASKDGKPALGKISVIITFYDPEQRAYMRGLSGPPLGGTVSDAVEKRKYELNKASYRYAECKPQELDEPLQIIESKLCLVHPPDEPARKGKVLVKYYIDHEGHIHLPEILKTEDEYLTLSVLETLNHTRFAPPKRNGNPALVSVRQPFNFD